MTKTPLAGQKRPQRRLPTPKDFDEHMTWRARWYLIIALPIGYILSIVGGLIGFRITGDLHYLLFITPTALIPFVYYLVPMDKRRYDLKLAKIENDKKLTEANARVQILEAEIGKRYGNKSKTPAKKT